MTNIISDVRQRVSSNESPSNGNQATATPAKKKKKRRPSTSHLKIIPELRGLRDQIRAEAVRFADTLDRSRPLTNEELQKYGEDLLGNMGLDQQSFLGFSMVCIMNEFWREQLMAVDFNRRLLLLPHCLKHAEGCPADYDEFGLDCRKCGACSIADFKVTAEDLGYKVLVAEGTPIVLKIIIGGYVDAVVGVACLNVLEKALEKIIQMGVPALAVPLLSSDCKNTSVDDDWVEEVIALKSEPPSVRTRTYVPLLRAANKVFEEDNIESQVPRPRKAALLKTENITGTNGSLHRALTNDPISSTEAIGFDFLTRGGKRFRPFITLAAYDALNGGSGTLPEANEHGVELPDHVLRTGIAIETFHKASLVHDDIEDDDTYRYGVETLHRKHGVPIALNVGDYLVGLGYRVIGNQIQEMGAECSAAILERLAESQVKLSEGQGAELQWREGADKDFTPLDALKIYALKTSPAFEAALFAGLRLAGPTDDYNEMVVNFSRNLGVAFQILNDLNDWEGDDNNKMTAGADALAARPTLLLALALEAVGPEDKQRLMELVHSPEKSDKKVKQIYSLFKRYDVFAKADKLVEKYRDRAEAVADDVEPEELRVLLYFLVDTILQRNQPEQTNTLATLPVISGHFHV